MATQEAVCTCGREASEEELLQRLDEVLAGYRGKPGALIPVLQVTQGMFGYLPEAALKRIALALGKSYSEVSGVVSFYSFFSTQPRGKHLIRVCLGTACYVRGGAKVLEAIKHELGVDVGQTTPDREFSLEVARCFGACGLAPAVSIDSDVHKRVRPIKVPDMLARYRGDAAPAPAAEAQPKAKPKAKAKAAKPKAAAKVVAKAKPKAKAAKPKAAAKAVAKAKPQAKAKPKAKGAAK